MQLCLFRGFLEVKNIWFLCFYSGCANKNNPLEISLYFSTGSTDLSQNFRRCMWIFTYMSCKSHWYGSTSTHWISTNNKSNFSQLYVNNSRKVLSYTVYTEGSNKASKANSTGGWPKVVPTGDWGHLLTLTLTSDDLESHIVVNVPSTSNIIPSFIMIGQSQFFGKIWSHVTR